MVSKEEYTSYIKKIIEKQDVNIKSLSWKYMLASIAVLIFGIILCICFIYLIFVDYFCKTALFLGVILIVCAILMFKKRSETKKLFREDIREKVMHFLLKETITTIHI